MSWLCYIDYVNNFSGADMDTIPASLANNLRTIKSYEAYAEQYSQNVAHFPAPVDEAALKRVAAAAGHGGRILEIGSGPGWEADFLETLGVAVRRTDATRRFLEIQAARGKTGDVLNVITDNLGGPYDAIVAMCVLIHVSRDQIDHVLTKIAQALLPNGAFLVSMRDGDGETLGKYHTVYWRRDDFVARLEATGFAMDWGGQHVDGDNDTWHTFLVRKSA
jgi:2-polyprenyl-3-methyl-5-hydroxy-6-metoxy-1,4-benzoquinol methylase